AELLRRRPDTDELTVHLLIGALTSGLVVIHRHWFTETGAAVDADSREVWARLLEQLLDTTRQGYGFTGS
ncbi:MAG: TetR/AcrR family transcriptional regulator, partial [Stackebrandtia sp.]